MVRNNRVILVVFVVLTLILLVPIAESKINQKDNKNNHEKSVGPKIEKSLTEKFKTEDSVNVIIIFEDDSAEDSSIKNNKKISKKSSKKNIDLDFEVNSIADSVEGFENGDKLEIINGYATTLTKDAYEKLLDDAEDNNRNIRIFEDKIMQVHSILSVGVATIEANYSQSVLGVTGLGVKVGIVDTGIEYTMSEFGRCYGNNTNSSCKVFGGYDFANNDNDPMDDNTQGHGTHVAGILAGFSENITGVAPNATLYALKACSSGGSCTTSNVINAINWGVNNSLDILSISLGSYASYEDDGNTGKDPLSLAVDNAVDSGIVVILSSGNNGPGVSTINTPGASENAITVGAINDQNTATYTDDSLWLESSVGPGAFGRLDPELVAPGYNIISTALGDYYGLTGTSMAVPFVSGSAALLLEKYPNLSPAEVRRMLIQSTNSISGKVFQRGTGEVDVKNALLYNVTGIVHGYNSYGEVVDNDRWEFVVTPLTTEYANITIVNYNNYNLSFNTIIENITNMENNITLNTTQLGIPSLINITSNSNYTFQINFTLTNFSAAYATTYGGIILINGSGNNGSVVTKIIRIPIVITVPILNKGYLGRIMYNDPDGDGSYTNTAPTHEDVYYYCYYSENPINTTVTINWSSSANWLSLYFYNSTADFISSQTNSGTNTQSISSSNTNRFKWLRIDGYDFTGPIIFTINVTNPSNSAPTIVNVTPINGSINSTTISSGSVTNAVLTFYIPANITINLTSRDSDNDTTNVTINDSTYTLVSTVQNGLNKHTIYTKLYNSSYGTNTSIRFTVTDIYDVSVTSTINVLYLSPIIINNYTSNTTPTYINVNSITNFTVAASDANSNQLYYYWIVNGVLNSTNTSNNNYTFNSTIFSFVQNNLTVLISNSNNSNSTNRSISWTIYVDSSNPNVTIANPLNSIYNDSRIDLNYTASDSSGISRCWYTINGTLNITNTTITSCANTTFYFLNGDYTINLYANDTVNNLGSSNISFTINDSTEPTIISTSPSGTQTFTSSVNLSVTTSENSTCKYDASDINYSSMSSSFTNNATLHTASYSVSASTAYLLYVRCMDINSNINNISSLINFTMNASSGGGSGGSGGGGSGGGSSGGSSGSSYAGSFSASSIIGSLHGSANATFNNDNIPVDAIEITASESNYSNVSVRVEKITSSKTIDAIESVSAPENAVDAYLNISQKNIPENDSLTIKIYFNVKQEWLVENNISENDVILLKYNPENQNWENLTTEMLFEDNESVYYVATSSEVGLYAISYENKTGGKDLVTVTPPVEENKTINKSAEPQVHSSDTLSSNTAGNTLFGDLSISEILEKEMKWVVYLISSVFVIMTAIGIIIRNRSHPVSAQKYEHDLLVSTNQEVKHLGVRTDLYSGNIPLNNSNIIQNRGYNPYTQNRYPGSNNNQNIIFNQNNNINQNNFKKR